MATQESSPFLITQCPGTGITEVVRDQDSSPARLCAGCVTLDKRISAHEAPSLPLSKVGIRPASSQKGEHRMKQYRENVFCKTLFLSPFPLGLPHLYNT